MTDLSDTPTFEPVYQLATTDQVLGGPGGIANRQAQALANRSAYLLNLTAGGSNRAARAFDLFDREDSTLKDSVAPSGHVWVTGGAGHEDVAIEDGVVVSNANTYCQLDYGTGIQRISGAFSFTSQTTNDRRRQSIAIIADTASQSFEDMLHLIISPNDWVMQKVVGGGSVVELGRGNHFLQPESIYGMAFVVDIVAHTVTVYPPQSPPVIISDADISAGTIAPRYGVWQITADADAFMGRWHGVLMGPCVGEVVRALSMGAPASDSPIYVGEGITARSIRHFLTPSTTGWYRIATQVGVMAGRVRLNISVTGVGLQVWDFDVSAIYSGTPIMAQRMGQGVAPFFINARVSTNTGNGQIALDIELYLPFAADIDATFDGYFIPSDPPASGLLTVGASAEPTVSTVLQYSETGVASAAQAAVVTTPASLASYGFTEAQANSIVTLLNELRRVAILRGDIKGGA